MSFRTRARFTSQLHAPAHVDSNTLKPESNRRISEKSRRRNSSTTDTRDSFHRPLVLVQVIYINERSPIDGGSGVLEGFEQLPLGFKLSRSLVFELNTANPRLSSLV